MNIPPVIRLSVALKNRGILYFQHDGFLFSEEPHFFIVINENPENDETLLLVVGTSQTEKIERRKAHARPETFIEVTPTEYPRFTKATHFNCNYVYKITKDDLLKKIAEEIFEGCDPLPDRFFTLIRHGVLTSKTIEGTIKKVVSSDYDI